MHTYQIQKATTDVSVEIRIVDSGDGTPETGVVWNTAGIALEYRRDGAASTAITEATLASLTTAHTDGGFLHIGNGVYRLDLPDAACATGVDKVVVHGTVTGMVVIGCVIQLVDYDPFDAVRMGMTALPNAAADAAGGLPISDAGGLDLDAMNTNINDIETDTSDMQPRVATIEVDTTTDIPALIATAQADLDTITGSDGVTLATAQALYAPSKAGDSMDILSISGDTTAANNLELQYDGTGLSGNTFPATQSQLNNVANVGSATHKPVKPSPNGFTITTGGTETGTEDNTTALDGTYHQIQDSAGTLDVYYEFTIGSGTPNSVYFEGYLNDANDSLNIYGYDWVAAGWVQIGTWDGTNGSTSEVHIHDLFVDMVGSGADEGTVRVRFQNTGLTSAEMFMDQIYVAFSQGVEGYDNGSVWIDTTYSNTNTEVGIDGVARNPVSTIAAANTLSASTNLHKFVIAPSSSITFAATQDNEVFDGRDWTLAFGGQDISGSHISGASRGVSGTYTASVQPMIKESSVGTVTGAPAAFDKCGFSGTFTVGSAGDFFLIDCFSQIAGASSPTIDMGGAVGATNVSVRRWSGGITFNNLAAGDVVSLDGTFGTITLNGADAQVEIRGIAKAVTNNLTGSPTVNDDSVKADSVEAILLDTAEIGTAGAGLTDLGGMSTAMKAEVNAEVLDVLDVDTFAELSAVPAANASMTDKINWIFMMMRNKITSTSSTLTLRNDADSGDVATAAHSDDTTTYTKPEWT